MIARLTFWQRFRRNRMAVFGLAVLSLVVAVALVGPPLYGADPWAMVASPCQAPGASEDATNSFAARSYWPEVSNASPYLK